MSNDKVIQLPQKPVNIESHIVRGTQANTAGRIYKCNCGCNSFCITENQHIICWNCGTDQKFGTAAESLI